jgi:hypothetical protein
MRYYDLRKIYHCLLSYIKSLQFIFLKSYAKKEYIKNTTTGVIFSKDRPIQLYALLESFIDCVLNYQCIFILYKCSDERYERAYLEIRQRFENSKFIFFCEHHFRSDLVRIIDAIKSERIFFLVDDIIFINKVDFAELNSFDLGCYVPSLRLGMQLTYCYPSQSRQNLPLLISSNNEKQFGNIWRWSKGEFDWKYPLSLDGNVFYTRELTIMISQIQFKGPNSLEAKLQLYNPIFIKRWGVCCATSRLINIPSNRVQSEIDNISGDLEAAKLLNKWNEGYKIHTKQLYNINSTSVHQDIEYIYIRR